MEKVAQAHARGTRDTATTVSLRPLRQRHVLARIGDPALHRPGPQQPAVDGHRSRHDPVPDVAGRVGAPGRARVHATPSRGTCSSARRSACTIGDLGDRRVRNCSAWRPSSTCSASGTARRWPRPWPATRSWRYAEDFGEYFRIPLDARDLNYSLYFDEGDPAGPGPARLHVGERAAVWTCRRSCRCCGRCPRCGHWPARRPAAVGCARERRRSPAAAASSAGTSGCSRTRRLPHRGRPRAADLADQDRPRVRRRRRPGRSTWPGSTAAAPPTSPAATSRAARALAHAIRQCTDAAQDRRLRELGPGRQRHRVR